MTNLSSLAIRLYHAPVSRAMLATLQKNFPALGYQWDERDTVFHCDVGEMTPKEVERLQIDMRFYDLNPTLPLENLCSRLDNYIPRNQSQEELLYYAQKLIALDDESAAAGLYLYGEAGIGKSHVSIGVAKEFMLRGLEPNFQFADRYTFNTNVKLIPGQVWVIDDMNSGYHLSSRLFKQVVLNAHERGGRVFVTSNKDYDELMKEMFVGDSKANKIRYEDRTKGMFKIIFVTGGSFRQANAWYNS
jgi:DNA replication protein DnaC